MLTPLTCQRPVGARHVKCQSVHLLRSNQMEASPGPSRASYSRECPRTCIFRMWQQDSSSPPLTASMLMCTTIWTSLLRTAMKMQTNPWVLLLNTETRRLKTLKVQLLRMATKRRTNLWLFPCMISTKRQDSHDNINNTDCINHQDSNKVVDNNEVVNVEVQGESSAIP